MTDADLLTLCVLQEAGGECLDGQAAVARVVLNRARLRFGCDGTIQGAILAHAQFSWTEYAYAEGAYRRVARDAAQQLARVTRLMAQAKADAVRWRAVAAVVDEVLAGRFGSALYDRLTPRTVLYDNLEISRPTWLASSRLVVKIGRHSFFEPG